MRKQETGERINNTDDTDLVVKKCESVLSVLCKVLLAKRQGATGNANHINIHGCFITAGTGLEIMLMIFEILPMHLLGEGLKSTMKVVETALSVLWAEKDLVISENSAIYSGDNSYVKCHPGQSTYVQYLVQTYLYFYENVYMAAAVSRVEAHDKVLRLLNGEFDVVGKENPGKCKNGR